MPCRSWWIAFVVLALAVGLVAGYCFAPFTTSTLTASTPSAPVTVAYSVPVVAATACSAPCTTCAAPACCSTGESGSCCCSKATSCCCTKSPSEAPKQYVHFLIKDIEVKTADATFTLGKVSFMYKGDGIEADVAKTALGADPSKIGKVVDVNELAERITKLMTTKASGDKSSDEKSTDDKPAPEAKPAVSSCLPAEECLPAPKASLTSWYEAAPAPCYAAPCGGCETTEKVEGCETEEKTPDQVEEAEPETLPAPTEAPAEDKIDD
jgi:hypothetical protein